MSPEQIGQLEAQLELIERQRAEARDRFEAADSVLAQDAAWCRSQLELLRAGVDR